MNKQIFLLKLQAPLSYHSGFEIVLGFVVVASSEARARRFATLESGDEGRSAWLTTAESVAMPIGCAKNAVKAGVILRDRRTC